MEKIKAYLVMLPKGNSVSICGAFQDEAKAYNYLGDSVNGFVHLIEIEPSEQPPPEIGNPSTNKPKKATELNTFGDQVLDHFDTLKREPSEDIPKGVTIYLFTLKYNNYVK